MMAIWTMSDHFSMRSKSKGFEVHIYLSQNITKLHIAQLVSQIFPVKPDVTHQALHI